MKLKTFDFLRERIANIEAAPELVANMAAPEIEAKFRADATTKRGNVPSYGEMGNVPIAVDIEGASLVVRGPDWCLQKAEEKGQVEEWLDIVQAKSREAMSA